jgi:hypothetical protein
MMISRELARNILIPKCEGNLCELDLDGRIKLKDFLKKKNLRARIHLAFARQDEINGGFLCIRQQSSRFHKMWKVFLLHI